MQARTFQNGNNALSQSWFNNILTWIKKTKTTGVKFYMLRDSRSVAWKCIEPELFSAAFGQNELYTTVSSELRFEQVDIQRIVEYEIEYTIKKETEIKKPEKKLKKRR